MSISLNRLDAPLALLQFTQIQQKQQSTPQPASNEFCESIKVLEWALLSEYDQPVKGTPDFDQVWDTVLKLPFGFYSLKARMLLPFVIAEGGDVWYRLLSKVPDALDREQRLDIFAWLLRYGEIPVPNPEFKELIATIQNRDIPSIPDDNHWLQLDVSDEDDIITQFCACASLLTDRQLEIIWEKLKQREMDTGKAQILLACVWFFPPRFWRERVQEFCDLPFHLLPSNDVKKMLMQVMHGYQAAQYGLKYFEAIFEYLRSSNYATAMKGLFNLIWSKNETLDLGELDVLMRLMETPLELREIALYINENYQRFKEEEVALEVVKGALLKDGVALYLSEEVVRDAVGAQFHLNRNASEKERLSALRLYSILVTGSNNDKVEWLHYLEIFPVYILWLERWPGEFMHQHRSVVVDFIMTIAPLLAKLRQDSEKERRVFAAYFKRAKRLLDDLEFDRFAASSLSLTNNFLGERTYTQQCILRVMKKEMLINGDGWFHSNRKLFEEMLEKKELFASAGKDDWTAILPVYRLYVSLFPNKRDWIAKAVSSYVNIFPNGISPEVLDQLLQCFDRTFCPLDVLKQAVTPGSSLIALLKKVDELSAGLPENSSQQIFDWANALLRRDCQDDQFWIEAQRLYQSITRKIPKSKRKKKGSHGLQFSTVWKKFENKMGEVASSEGLLKTMIDQKRAEVRLQANQRFGMAHDLYLKQYQGPFAELIADSRDEFRVKNEGLAKILELLNQLPQKISVLDEKIDQELEKLHEIRNASELQKKLAIVSENLIKDAETQASQIEKKIEEIANSVLAKTAAYSYYSLWEDGLREPVRKIEPTKQDKERAASHIGFNELLTIANHGNES
jgi:hypothetical protein